jgi:hypothetical protein
VHFAYFEYRSSQMHSSPVKMKSIPLNDVLRIMQSLPELNLLLLDPA